MWWLMHDVMSTARARVEADANHTAARFITVQLLFTGQRLPWSSHQQHSSDFVRDSRKLLALAAVIDAHWLGVLRGRVYWNLA